MNHVGPLSEIVWLLLGVFWLVEHISGIVDKWRKRK
jgi:hypothetical protein